MRPGDEHLVVIFQDDANPNPARSAEAGRPIYDDRELCVVRFPGSKNVFAFPALTHSHWEDDLVMGRRSVSYAERFSRQYQQFRAREQQTKTGTPLNYLLFLTEGKKAELRALNIYTCEALAAVDGAELKNLGHGGRDLKNQAQEFMSKSSEHARITKLQADMEALAAKNATLEQDLQALRVTSPTAEFDGMTDEQLRDYVKSLTGIELRGNLPRKTLLRMIQEHRGASDNMTMEVKSA